MKYSHEIKTYKSYHNFIQMCWYCRKFNIFLITYVESYTGHMWISCARTQMHEYSAILIDRHAIKSDMWIWTMLSITKMRQYKPTYQNNNDILMGVRIKYFIIYESGTRLLTTRDDTQHYIVENAQSIILVSRRVLVACKSGKYHCKKQTYKERCTAL